VIKKLGVANFSISLLFTKKGKRGKGKGERAGIKNFSPQGTKPLFLNRLNKKEDFETRSALPLASLREKNQRLYLKPLL
jgi:hypothetical protein